MTESPYTCAMYLAEGPELRIVWANDAYLSMINESLRGDAIGMRLDELSAVGAMRAQLLLEVMHTGEPQHGQDMTFSVENGSRVHEWHAYRPLPDHVLVSIVTHRAGPESAG